MIHLDTNYLIGLLVKGSPQAADVDGWLAAGESLAASAIAWTEFLNGPVTPLEVNRVQTILQSRILAFGEAEAVKAASLFNSTGRRRGSRLETGRDSPYPRVSNHGERKLKRRGKNLRVYRVSAVSLCYPFTTVAPAAGRETKSEGLIWVRFL